MLVYSQCYCKATCKERGMLNLVQITNIVHKANLTLFIKELSRTGAQQYTLICDTCWRSIKNDVKNEHQHSHAYKKCMIAV